MATIVTLLGKVECAKPESSTTIWNLQGAWAFGENDPAPITPTTAEEAAPASLPFAYTFERVVDARMTPIPSLQPPDEPKPPVGGVVSSPTAVATTTTTPSVADAAPKQDSTAAAETTKNPPSQTEQTQNDSTKEENTIKPMDIDTPEKGKETPKAPNEKEEEAKANHANPQNESQQNDSSKTEPSSTKASGDKMQTTTTEASSDKKETSGDKKETGVDNTVNVDSSSAPQKPKGPTFGDDGFVDACTKHPACPPSGRWRGSFQAATGRKGQHQQPIPEHFDLFLYADPPPDNCAIQFSNPQSRLPEQHIYVRGAGENQFGTFELLGTYSMTTGVLRVQRLYVRIPPEPPRRGRGRRPRHHGSANADTNVGRSTRKRQLSWKRRAMDETAAASAATAAASAAVSVATGSEDGKPAKRQKRKRADGDASVTTTTTTGTAASTGVGSGIPRTVDTSGGTASTTTTTTPKAAAAATSASRLSTTPHGSTVVRIPVEGDVRQARWRAAHFYHYNPAPKDAGDNNGNGSTIKSVVYEGETYDGVRDGRGVCVYNNDMTYEGQWMRDKEHGYGTLFTGDKKRIIYQGEWERGRMHGQGKYYYYTSYRSDDSSRSNRIQSRYEGEFRENLRHGTGMYVLPDGSTYNGQWQNGAMNGRGVFTWPDGSVYDGEWKDNKRHGQGMLKASDGFFYEGTWVHNTIDGRGMARYPDGQEYNGMFSNGRREGRGTVKFPNGAVYEGRFRDDAVDGQGTMKIRKAVLIPRDDNGDDDDDDDGDGDENNVQEEVGKEEKAKTNEENNTSAQSPPKADFMIPISFQSDMGHIHRKAGFTLGGI